MGYELTLSDHRAYALWTRRGAMVHGAAAIVAQVPPGTIIGYGTCCGFTRWVTEIAKVRRRERGKPTVTCGLCRRAMGLV